MYTVELENSNVINEFKKIVEQSGKKESDILLSLMSDFINENKKEQSSMDILFEKMEENKDVFIRMRDK